MPARGGIKINIVGNFDAKAFDQLKRELGTVDKNTRGFGQRVGSVFRTSGRHIAGVARTIKKVGKAAAIGIAGLAAAVGAGIVTTVNAASDLEESANKVAVVFDKNAPEIRLWARNASTALGQSEQEALEAAGTFGNLFRAMGVSADASTDMSKEIIQLSADLASFNNANPEDVLLALRSGLVGEAEPLRKFGVSLSAARIEQEALNSGLADSKEHLTAGAKAQAAFNLIMKDTTLAQGDFARTSDGLANQQRILSARFKDLKARIGRGFLPIATKAAAFLGDTLFPVFEEVGGGVSAMVAAFQNPGDGITSGGLAGQMEHFGILARGLVDDIKKHWPEIQATAERVFNRIATVVRAVVAAVRQHWPEIQRIIANVVNTVSTIIGGAVAVITTLWNNFGDNILSYVQRVWPAVQAVISGALQIIRGIVKTITALIRGDWSGAWEGIKAIVSGAWRAILGLVRVSFEQLRATAGIALEIVGSIFKRAWSTITTGASNAVGSVVGFFAGLPGKLLGLVGSVLGAAGEIGGAIVKGIVGAISGAAGEVADIGRSIVRSLISFVNTSIIDRINDGIPDKLGWGRVSINLPDNPIPHIPGLAEGGNVIRRGTALVGEDGPELLRLPRGAQVIPLDRAQRAGGGTVVRVERGAVQVALTIAGDVTRDVLPDLEAAVDERIRTALRELTQQIEEAVA